MPNDAFQALLNAWNAVRETPELLAEYTDFSVTEQLLNLGRAVMEIYAEKGLTRLEGDGMVLALNPDNFPSLPDLEEIAPRIDLRLIRILKVIWPSMQEQADEILKDVLLQEPTVTLTDNELTITFGTPEEKETKTLDFTASVNGEEERPAI